MSSNPANEPGRAAPAMPYGVLVIDDQRAVREGLARLIACSPVPMVCVGTAATGAEALTANARLHPDVILLDVDLAGEDGLALIPQLAQRAGILVLTSHGDAATRARAAALGALAFVEKHEPAAELLRAIVRTCHLQSGGEKGPGAQGTTSPPPLVASSAARPRPAP